MDEKLVDEKSSREWHAWHRNKPERARKHEEMRLRAESELLGEGSTMREYNQRREELKTFVVEPDIPMDEMTMSDYIKMRNRGER